MSPCQVDKSAHLLLRLIGAQSHSTEEEAVARLLCTELVERDFDVTIDDLGNVVGVRRFGDGPVVLFDAHLDTVEVPDPSRWSHAPDGALVDGAVYGRGAVDMKGALAACLVGVDALPALDRGTLVISGSVCEELVEGAALSRVIEEARPDVVVIGEPSAQRLMLGQRGRAEVQVEVQGRTSHSAYPEAGVNAAEVMADVMGALRGLSFPEHPELGSGMIALTNLNSHPHPNVSMLPETCRATYDRRTVLAEERADILDAVRAVAAPIAEAAGAEVRVELATTEFTTWTGHGVAVESFAPAWCTPGDHPVVVAARAGLDAAGLDDRPEYYKFCTNGSASAGRHGITTLGFGPGDPDQAHRVDESIRLEDLSAGVRGYTALLGALLSV